MENKNYTPDVLQCLANLSNDEVFTPPKLVNDILDLLPQELFKNKNTKFLDPCCKTGVFLREIAKRLIKGLENEIPDLQERLNHIFTKQLYGIAITELTALLSRRTLYCCKNANGKYSICTEFTTQNGNIFFNNINHTWENGKCKYCGASEELFNNGEELDSHAYEFIHKNTLKEILDMKFDVIIGNPPYQMGDGGGTGDSAKPIYNLFVENALKLDPRYLIMIIPSRWMKGGKGLENFRKQMINNKHIKIMFDFENASDIFPSIHLDGGVCYFLYDSLYNGMVEYNYRAINGDNIFSKRFLKNDFFDTVIRDYRQISIFEKIYSKMTDKFSSIVSYRNPYGFCADLFNNPEKYNNAKLNDIQFENSCKIYGVKGKKGGAKRIVGYVDYNSIEKNKENINKYKLFFSKAYLTTSTVPPEIIIGLPNTICTETFLEIGTFENLVEAENCLQYIKTKFFRALLFFNRHSLNISKESFDSIPMQDFNKILTDIELYKKYNLNQDEIDFIENTIKEMK